MGYEHSLMVVAKALPGTPVEVIAKAFAPIIESRYEARENPFDQGGLEGYDRFVYDIDTGDIDVYASGEVGYDHIDLVTETASLLGKVVTEPGEIWLYNHDTGDIDNEAKKVVEFGQSEEAIRSYKAKRDIKAGIEVMKNHLDEQQLRQIERVTNGGSSSEVDPFKMLQAVESVLYSALLHNDFSSLGPLLEDVKRVNTVMP